ncbi:MAG TPA: chemotaxis protein CheW [Bacillota bacterium]|nr:chemotaxis protein CheW [Bacillota bacterium]
MTTEEMYNYWQDLQMVAFKIGTANYAMDIHNVQEIVRRQQVTRLPNAPEQVEGVINLRGTVLPTINLHKLFGIAQPEDTEDSRLVIVKVDNLRYGIMVDQASEVLRIPGTAIESTPEINSKNPKDYIIGVAKYNEELWVLLDAQALTQFFRHKAMTRGQ